MLLRVKHSKRKLMRIGLFGGSFDPVHSGHLLVAQAACEQLHLDRFFFIPAAQSPFKDQNSQASCDDRLRLLRLALAGNPNWELDLQEIERGGVSYTIDTVRNIQSRFPDAQLFFLIGADHVDQLTAWKDSKELAEMAEFLILGRPGNDDLGLPEPFKGKVLKGVPFGVSSTMIRERVRLEKSIRHLVPDTVAEAIQNNRLYL